MKLLIRQSYFKSYAKFQDPTLTEPVLLSPLEVSTIILIFLKQGIKKHKFQVA